MAEASSGGLSFGAATEGYEDDPQAKLCNEVCVEVFRSIHGSKSAAARAKGHYIFEIGAGTGGTTSFVLPTFDPNCTRFVFTDLSQAFLTNARARFGAKFPFIEYTIFNGDRHPGDQGFHSHEMTEVLATNVIHATMHLASTMAACHVLLEPGGHIVFNEVQNAGTIMEDLTYGLTDGWWMLTDTERRVTYPLLKVPEWGQLFTSCGFRNVWHTPDQGSIFSQQAVLVAQSGRFVQPTHLGLDPMPRADPTASYLFTGAVGGLGLIAALILVERGARFLHFVSRRDKVPAEALKWYERIEQSSATVRRERCDVSSEAQVAKLFVDTPEWPRCAGIVHAAGVLSDGTIQKQSRKKYSEVFGPKLLGAWHLHRFYAHKLQKLQLNVMFSSAAGFFGSPGQNNHASANAGIEALADMNRRLGLPGAAIAWGAVAEVGYAARHNIADGPMAVSFDHAWAAMEALLAKPFSNVAIQPSAWEFGKGALPMKAVIFAGTAARFRRTGFRRTAAPAAAPSVVPVPVVVPVDSSASQLEPLGTSAEEEKSQTTSSPVAFEQPSVEGTSSGLPAVGRRAGEATSVQLSTPGLPKGKPDSEEVLAAMQQLHNAWHLPAAHGTALTGGPRPPLRRSEPLGPPGSGASVLSPGGAASSFSKPGLEGGPLLAFSKPSLDLAVPEGRSSRQGPPGAGAGAGLPRPGPTVGRFARLGQQEIC